MTQSNLNEVLAQFEQKVCYGTELDLYRYICQRNYSKVLVRELEFPSESESIGDGTENLEEKVFPFFEIEIDEISYDAKAMGFGEFCACYLVWKIFRSNKGSILLFDEPDSHLSPLSRLSLSNAMALVAKERELWICFSTHSIEMLEELIEDEIFIVSSDVSQWLPRVPPASGRRRAMITLGLAQQRCLLIVVEDVDSVEVVWSMVNRWGSEIAKCLDVQIIPDGAENVLRFVAEFPCDARICRVIAALDGDKRIYGDARAPGRIFYLPSDYDPILAAKTFVEHDCRSFANLLGVDPDELRKSLRRIAHVNHHDFLRELLDRQQFGGRTVSSLRTALINEWLSDEAVSSDARDFVQNILIQQIDQISRPIETLP
jgi:hypothetical protein